MSNNDLIQADWSLAAVQMPGAPRLTIRTTSSDTAIVGWPSASPGFALQECHELNRSTWAPAHQTVADTGINKFIIIHRLVGSRCYRLVKT